MNFKTSALIILAAGRSTRMGFPKGNLLFDGRRLLERHCEAFLEYGGRKIYIVQSSEHLKDQTYVYARKYLEVEFIENNRVDQTSMFESLWIALPFVRDFSSVFVMPVDVAPISPKVFASLSEAFIDHVQVVIPEFQKCKGHPVLLSHSFCRHLLTRDPSKTRLDYEMNQLQQGKVLCPVEDIAITRNLNSPELMRSP